ncbi:hypothetical protein J5N52_04705 [Acinetobacter soli]|uniref:hypothetical protein n=1 Tax=Acinetobacter soli TaxID=487316 RepID=UPI001ABC6E35|nr:hypothetical protein [Acinetobacter soli]MBO3671324.1 hypothetical protein [Acinetobacter soli]
MREIGIELARGGPDGNMNEQAKALVARTELLKEEKANKTDIVQGQYRFATLALFNEKKATIPVNSTVIIDEAGENQGANTWDGTTLKKSAYDPLAQAKNDASIKAENAKQEAIEQSSPRENFNIKGSPDNLIELRDSLERIVAIWNLKAEYVGKLLTDGILKSVEQPDGSNILSLGDGKEVNLYGSTFTLDFSNPDVAFQILSSDNKVVFSVPLAGADLEQIISQVNAASQLTTAFNVLNREDGITKDEVFQSERLSETRRKVAALEAGESEQLVISSIGNSWMDTPSYFTQYLTKSLKAKYGNAGAGFAAVERGFADPDEAKLIKSGTWTVTNGATSNDVNAEGFAIIKASSSTATDYIQAQLSVGVATKAKLYAKANNAVIEVSGSGVTTQQITLSNTVNEFVCNLDVNNSGTQYIRFKLISGEFVAFGVELQNTNKGIRFNKAGAGASRWTRWLATDATVWKEQFAALGADLTLMMEGVNGSFAYNGTAEAGYTDQMITRVREALKNTDILLLSPPEILMTHSYPLADFQYALRGKAKDWKLCHVDLQKTFGESLADYNDSGRGYILLANPNHPSSKGARLIANTLFKLIAG